MYKPHFRVLVTIAVLLCLTTIVNAQTFPVGNRNVTLVDASRNREIGLLLYYPAQTVGSDAALANGSFPLLTFGHGFLIPAANYSDFATLMAERGVVVALPSTEGGFSPNHDAFGKDIAFINTWYRSGQDNFYTCNGSSALGGHSMGGGASVLAASQTTANAYFGMAPALTNPSPVPVAPSLGMPALVVSGSVDNVTPPAEHHQPIWDAFGSECKVFATINGGNHCYYIPSSVCDLGEIGSGVSLTRAEQQEITFDMAWPFLRYWLGGNLSDWSSHLQNIASDSRVQVQETCSSVLRANDINRSELLIYPQPAVGAFFLRGMIQHPLSVSLLDVTGRKHDVEISELGNDIRIEPKQALQGLYLLQVESDAKTQHFRVLFEK